MSPPTHHPRRATALAHPNIALAKYWGKRPGDANLPAVPSLSLTLAGMQTRTEVCFDAALAEDRLTLDDQPRTGRALGRVGELLDLVWGAGLPGAARRPRATVTSKNDFPTASGLASSASAFAALAVAANAALGKGRSSAELSALARRVSASAARSFFGGFVALAAGVDGSDEPCAEPLVGPAHWPLRLVVALTSTGEKAVGSTEGMTRTAASSPLYDGWLAAAPQLFERVRRAVLDRNLGLLGAAMEHSALCMHATALAADPGLLYWNAGTIEVMHAVRALRRRGLEAYFTIDAGPHVKVLTAIEQHDALVQALTGVPGVLGTISTAPGGPARLAEEAEGAW